jgi:nitrogen regulatory protein P-II 1
MGIKRVQAIVRNEQVEAIIDRLALVGVRGLTIVPVRGSSSHERRREVYRSSAYEAPFVPKVALEWCGPEEQVDAVVGAILLRGATGKVGDGKVFVEPVLDAVRIRTGEHGEDAL